MANRSTCLKHDPQIAAQQLFDAHRGEADWLDAFTEHLDRQRAGAALQRTLSVWDMSQAEAARVFGISRQAVGKWLDKGVPPERAEMVADLAAATDLLVRYLKRERIPAVVRRPIALYADRSLLDLLAEEGGGTVLEACRRMFDFAAANS